MPHPDNPIQGPCLGRETLFLFDNVIIGAMEVNQRTAAWIHGKALTQLQRVGCQILPNGFSIALSIRELVRSGHLFSTEVLLRPLIERVAVISHLMEIGDNALDLWERGWRRRAIPGQSC
jgi:hypothetical protein